MLKISYFGNPYIGMYIRANDEFGLVPIDAEKSFCDGVKKTLDVEVEKVKIYDSSLIGLYTAMNCNGIVLPHIAYDNEVKKLKKILGDMNVCTIETRHTAIGNIIACNDKGAIVSKDIEDYNVKKIQDCLGVEVIPMQISNYNTLGSMCVANNKGFLVYNDIDDEEMEILEKIFKTNGINTTVNFGFQFPSYGVVTNNKDCVVGNKTTGIETMRIQRGLGFTEK